MNDEAVRDLARRAGIAVDWNDYAGRPQVVAPDVLQRILDALELPSATRGDLLESRKQVARRTTLRTLPPLITAIAGRPTRLDVGGGDPSGARLVLETGETRDVTLSPVRGRLRLPAIAEPGYHRLLIDDRDIVVAVAPSRCMTIDDAVPDARLWGVAAQVYALRQQGDGGIGDAAGIATLAELAGARGADAIALSPLHALFTADPTRFGPYSPSTRLFLNPLHASPALVFGDAHVAGVAREHGLNEALAKHADNTLIDWPSAAQTKLKLLRHLFEAFLAGTTDSALHADFAQFRADGGELLMQHAVFEALHAVQSAAGLSDWRHWSVDMRDAGGTTVAVFAASHEVEVRFHSFLQWLADRSLAIAQSRALAAGMRIGLIADLAVGMDPTGSHAWSRQVDILGKLAIGAPPDLFNPRGQDWGLTGFSPRALLNGGFAAFLATVRAVLRRAGGVRIDHAMGLTRLWLIPDGADPAHGAYLAYPLTDLLRLLALESQRHSAILVGEDLGTVPDGFRDAMDAAGIHGMRVLWFERDEHGFGSPTSWTQSAVAMTSTHDLPTTAAWWRGHDISTRATCGRLGIGESEKRLLAERATDRGSLWRTFTVAGATESAEPPPDDPVHFVDAALEFAASTDSPLFMPPIEDVLGVEEQPNLPGTTDQYPNWRRRLPAKVTELFDEPQVSARVAKLAARRPRL